MVSHIILLAAQHKRAHHALTQPVRLVLDLPTPEGWKAELT